MLRNVLISCLFVMVILGGWLWWRLKQIGSTYQSGINIRLDGQLITKGLTVDETALHRLAQAVGALPNSGIYYNSDNKQTFQPKTIDVQLNFMDATSSASSQEAISFDCQLNSTVDTEQVDIGFSQQALGRLKPDQQAGYMNTAVGYCLATLGYSVDHQGDTSPNHVKMPKLTKDLMVVHAIK